MMWGAIGGLTLVLGAWAASVTIAWHMGGTSMRVRLKLEQSERRAARRTEARKLAGLAARSADPFPEEWTERLATPEEYSAAAETGDVDTLHRETAAFFRSLALHGWTRKRDSAA